MADNWDAYRAKFGKTPEQAQKDAEAAQKGAQKSGGSDIGGKLKSAWLNMTGQNEKPREQK